MRSHSDAGAEGADQLGRDLAGDAQRGRGGGLADFADAAFGLRGAGGDPFVEDLRALVDQRPDLGLGIGRVAHAARRGDALAAVGDDLAGDLDRRGDDLAQPGLGGRAALVLVFAPRRAVADGDDGDAGGPGGHFATRALRLAISFRRSQMARS